MRCSRVCSRKRRGYGTRAGVLFLLLVAAVTNGGCEAITTEPAPNATALLITVPPRDPGVLAAAWTVDLFHSGEVRVTPPERDAAAPAQLAPPGVELEAVTGSARWSQVGARRPGLVHATAAVRVRNGAETGALAAAAFPHGPADARAAALLAIDVSVPPAPGSVSSDGEWVRVELPNRGLAAASGQWPGSPRSVANAAECRSAQECYRWLELPRALAPGDVSTPLTLGFDAEPGVFHIRVKVLVVGSLR